MPSYRNSGYVPVQRIGSHSHRYLLIYLNNLLLFVLLFLSSTKNTVWENTKRGLVLKTVTLKDFDVSNSDC